MFAALVACLFTTSLSIAGDIRLTQTVTLKLPINARTLAWHPDSQTLAAGGWSGMLTVWDTQTGKLIRDLKQADNAQMGEIQYSKDGKLLAVGKSMPGRKQAYLSILDASTFQVIDKLESPKMLEGSNTPLQSLSIDPTTSKRIALSSYINKRDPVIFTTGDAKNKLIQTSPESPNTVRKISFSPTGEIIAVGRLNSVIDIYSGENGQRVNSFSAFSDDWWIRAMIFSPDGKYIFVASNTGAEIGSLDKTTGKWLDRKNNEPIKMWDVQTQSLSRTFDTQGSDIESLDASSDGRHLFVGLSSGKVIIWDVKTGAEIKHFQPSQNYTIVKLSPDGKHLATSDTGSTEIKIWELIEQ
jgi:WD40 repeat protein